MSSSHLDLTSEKSSLYNVNMTAERRDRDGDSILWDSTCFYTIPNNNITTKDGTISTKTIEVISTCHFDLTSESLI